MFREMRRIKQQLTDQEIQEIIVRNTCGTLALLGDEGYPYSVPLSYVYTENKFYFHSAKTGHKIDAVKNYEKASFSIIDKYVLVPEEYTAYFRSVIAFGKVRLLEDPQEIRFALDLLGKKVRPGFEKERLNEVNISLPKVAIIEFTVEHLSGKESIELRKI